MRLNIQLFASGTITFTADGNLQGKIEWSSTSNGSSLNSSNVTAILYAKVTSGTTTGKSWTGYVKIGDASGHNFNGFSSSKSISSSWVKMAEYTDTISHNDDGTKSITISGWVKGPTTTTLENKKSSGSSSATLDTIPRASEITAVYATPIPSNPNLTFTPKSASFKYRVRYTYNNLIYQSSLISPNTTSPYTYSGVQLPLDIFSGVSSSPITITASLYTYDANNNPITPTATKTFSVTLTTDAKPTITIGNLSEADTTMISKNWGIYVQGKSKLSFKVTTGYSVLQAPNVTTTASTNSQPFSFNGYANKTFTTNVLNTTGTNTITASATDSRNRTTTATAKTYSVVAYSAPTINTAQVQRCDANGNVDKNGQYCLISYSASISSCDNHNKAGAEYKIGYRVQNTGNYNYVPLGTNANSKSASGILFTDGIKSASSSGTKVQFSDSTYDIQFYVKDSFTTVTNTQPLDAGFDLLNFNASGKAMAIGKVSEATSSQELLEVALSTEMQLGSYNSEGRNTSGETKYLNIINLTITRAWTDIPLIFNLSCRANHWARVFVKFSNQNTTDPTLAKFSYVCDNGCPLKPYIKKTGTSNWSIYVYAVNNEVVSVTQLEYSPYIAERINITYPNVLVDTPTDGYEAEYEQIQIRQVYKEKSDTSTGQNFHLLGATSENEGMSRPLTTNGAYIWAKSGTTEIDGESGLILGNSIATGNDGNKRGGLRIFSPNTGSNYVYARGHTSSYTSYLPMKTGDLLVQPKRLYYDASGSNGNITISESAENYTYFEIFWRYGSNSTRGSLKLHLPDGRKFQITSTYDDGTYMYLTTANYSVSGTTITKNGEVRWRFGTSGSPNRATNTNIYIYRVDGIWVRNDAQ